MEDPESDCISPEHSLRGRPDPSRHALAGRPSHRSFFKDSFDLERLPETVARRTGVPWPTSVLLLAQTTRRETAYLEASNPGRSGDTRPPYRHSFSPSAVQPQL